MILMLLKVTVTPVLTWGAWQVLQTWRRNPSDTDYLWMFGSLVWAIVVAWASGLLLWLALASAMVCLAVFCISMLRQCMTSHRRQAELEAEIERGGHR